MRIFFLGLYFLAAFSTRSQAQQFLMLDKQWYKPAALVDTITREALSKGAYPIYMAEFDSFLTLVNKFRDIKNDGFDRKFYFSDDFKTEHISFQIENIRRAYGDGYEINISSSTPAGIYTLKIADPSMTLPLNQTRIRQFIDYLKVTKKNLDNPKKKKKNNPKSPFVD